ncbi:MAG: Ig-like domain-containing protein, partial [Armatimonadota bacterium]
NDAGGCTLSTHPECWFVADFSPPVFFDEIPADGSLIGGTPPEISINVIDSLSGLDVSSLSMNVDGTIYTIESGLTYSGGRLTFTPSGLFDWTEGDTICITAIASDLVTNEYCGPNRDSTRWCFLIDFLHLCHTEKRTELLLHFAQLLALYYVCFTDQVAVGILTELHII